MPGSVQEIGIAAVPVHAGMDKPAAEVEQAHQLPLSHPPAEGQDVGAAGLLHGHVRPGVKAGLRRPDGLHLPEALEKLALAGLRVRPPLRQVPGEVPPVEIAAVLPLVGVVVIAPVVEPAHLVAAVNHGDAALAEHPGVEGQIAGHGPLQKGGVPLRRLHAAEGGGGAAEAGIPQAGVVVIELPPAGTAGPFAGKPVVEEFLVGHLVRAGGLRQPGIIQAPADVVVAAEVVEEEEVLGQGADGLHLPL